MTDRDHPPSPVLALDELLTDPPEWLRAYAAEVLNTHVGDQFLAACRDAHHALKTISAVDPAARVDHPDPGQVEDWLRLGLLDTLLAWLTGKGRRTCMHAPHPARPEPVYAAAYKPGLVVCAQCLPMLRVSGEADRACDACGHVCAGLEHGDPCYPIVLALGPFTYAAGACPACRPQRRRPHDQAVSDV
jgi:hypothetical protein